MMRKPLRIALAGLSALALAGSAGAATLPYGGTLTLRFGTSQGGGSFSWGDIQAVAVTGQLLSLAFAGGEVGPVTTSIPVTSIETINSVVFSGVQNLPGTITGISGGAPLGDSRMGLQGTMKICLLFAACANANVTIPLTPTASTGMGVGGTQIIPGTLALTMQHAPWTIGTPTMTIHTVNSSITTPVLPGGFAHGPASLTSSTAQSGGELQMVTATKAFTSSAVTGTSGCGLLMPEFVVSASLNLRFAGQCSDGGDNDGDGLVDFPDDPGCDDAQDGSERSPALVCDNGLDDDSDGFVDYPGDPGCRKPDSDFEDAACQDGIDNDGDTLIDFDGGLSIFGSGDPRITEPDPHCINSYKDNEGPNRCGLGVELALLLPPLAWLYLRRRRKP